MRRALTPAGLVVGAVLLLAAAASPHGIKEGSTFRVGIPASTIIDSIDPALATFQGAAPVFDATCGGLYANPALPFPQGLRLVPEIAEALPKITNGDRTYTFTIRKGVRFSTGTPVTARSFAHTINRVLNPTMDSRYAPWYEDIVGAQQVIDGKATTASGIVARGSTLSIRLRKPLGAFIDNIASLCVVPESMPIDAEGAQAPIPGAGPYYISEYVPNERIVLERNRYYAGSRPRSVDRFVVEIGGDSASLLDRVERGEIDYAPGADYSERGEEFHRKYGLNQSRFFGAPALNLRIFALNTSRPLFRKNPKLRQAVNFAVDRKAILREKSGGLLSGYLTDQYLPPSMPGFRNERIYPLKGPDLNKAQALARGRTRGGKAVAYVSSSAPGSLAQGQVLAANLAKIGINVEIKAFPSSLLFQKMLTPGEPFDIGWVGLIGIRTPGDTILSTLFDGDSWVGPVNFSSFDSPKYNRLLRAASRLPYGPEREEAHAALDVDLAKNAAPAIAYAYDRTLTLVSARTGCVVVNPNLDLTAVCLK